MSSTHLRTRHEACLLSILQSAAMPRLQLACGYDWVDTAAVQQGLLFCALRAVVQRRLERSLLCDRMVLPPARCC
jgi:hypothetical protein